MTENEIYEKLIQWLNQAWWGLPEAPEVLPLIRRRYSPDEAELLTGMPFSGKGLEELAAMKGMESARLAIRLDALAKKGLVFRSAAQGKAVRYSLNDSFFVFLRSTFWPGYKDEPNRILAPLANQYYYHGFFDGYARVETRGLRTLPVKETIRDSKVVLPYEDMTQFLDLQEYFTVSVCPCRHRKNLDPHSPDCPHPAEVCLHFGKLGHYIVENDLGREITKQEAHEILKLAADSGLVHGLSNWQQEADTICNCCKCCCMWFESYHVLKHAKSLDASNFEARIHPETCKGCGLCSKRCPMEAIKLETSAEGKNSTGKIAVLDLELCLGCGVCAHKCPTQSIILKRRRVISEPPADPRDYMKRFFTERARVQEPE
jgi:electron transport complex protein RnfB